MVDNTIYKILPNCKKIDIVDIELENNNIIDRYEPIQFDEPIVIETVQDSKKKKRRFFGRK